jgi:glycogen synthase
MQTDFSWQHSAREYLNLYHLAERDNSTTNSGTPHE